MKRLNYLLRLLRNPALGVVEAMVRNKSSLPHDGKSEEFVQQETPAPRHPGAPGSKNAASLGV
jgi:hypothetical protein